MFFKVISDKDYGKEKTLAVINLDYFDKIEEEERYCFY